MNHLPDLIQDLALILASAAMVTLFFKRFHQPTVLGYIIAGFLIGPHFKVLPSVMETENIRIWGDIGVIVLLFSLGLEFSFKKLARVGGAASITAAIEVPAMMILGFLAGRTFGWTALQSVFLGGVLAISSTTIIIRVFEETGVKGRAFVNLVFGVLIVEDLIAIVILALLSALTTSQGALGSHMLIAIAKLLFFLTLWFLAGIFALPTLMSMLRSYLSSETLLVISLGLCFGMVLVSTTAGFSPALGAFIMGSLLGETSEGKKIEHIVAPIKDLFAAIFFVCVGMSIEPQTLQAYALPIALLTLVFILGKTFFAALGILISGKSLRVAIQTGLSLAQIGEFSFLIAGLGVSMGVANEGLYPLAVGVSALTTFLSPFLIRTSDFTFEAIDRRLSKRWKAQLDAYSRGISALSGGSDLWLRVRAFLIRTLAHAVLIGAIFTGCRRMLVPALHTVLKDPFTISASGLVSAFIFSAPFFWALTRGRGPRFLDQANLENAALRALNRFSMLARWLIALLLMIGLSARFLPLSEALPFVVACTVMTVFLFEKYLGEIYSRIERRFVKNLSSVSATTDIPPLAPWDGHLTAFEIDPRSKIVGLPLSRIGIRELCGVSVALIQRGDLKIAAPEGKEMIFPYDRVFVIGTDEQISAFQKFIEPQKNDEGTAIDDFSYSLESHRVDSTSPLVGRSLREAGIRERCQGLVVGIEREGRRVLNPHSDTMIETGDILWIVGETGALKKMSMSAR